ncbi:DUF3159 domain-containing protein [Herbiconiux sp. KACC 21604]|uniref:DUF3159 domain-containing protein n=1 Tax=unclassified Herbiconiux TaxID=2618217 RepID=UPI0014909E6F|nr:DUF3159 domain-containing protein [Herbiconiux sp. SALV-R1]QJU53653.1 DUF3159 domain-containing protein [Herbiconiux sp. SALV-R1]WPO88638.1 DUF3159 domain-containing protein [Herbiconiux sp. KACC 21604]
MTNQPNGAERPNPSDDTTASVDRDAAAAGNAAAADRADAPQTFHEAFAQAARNAGIGQVKPGETPTASSLLRAIGGVRGLIESILPGLAFLVLYTFTKNLVLAVSAPVAVSVVFVIVRLVTRSAPMPAIAGLIGVGVSAGLALFTGRAEDNFLVGIAINVVCLVVLLISLIARRPLIGVIVGLLANDPGGYRTDRAKGRVVLVATWCWVGLFAARLIVELPLYWAGQTELLGSVKLIMGVPLYAGLLWVTWLLVRAAYAKPAS